MKHKDVWDNELPRYLTCKFADLLAFAGHLLQQGLLLWLLLLSASTRTAMCTPVHPQAQKGSQSVRTTMTAAR